MVEGRVELSGVRKTVMLESFQGKLSKYVRVLGSRWLEGAARERLVSVRRAAIWKCIVKIFQR